MKKYDAIVIGSGQAGNPLWQKLTGQGWKVALIEREHLGGTCINTGCTPTKTMVHCAQVAHYAREAGRWGVRTAEVRVDLAQVVALKDRIVQQFRGGKEKQAGKTANLDLYRGHGRFSGAHTVEVGGETLEGRHIFINTGTRPEIPQLDGLDRVPYLTNASLMELRELPEHLLVLGGGYIGLEFGQMFRRFGSRVTVVHRGAEILAREDPDVAGELRKTLEAEGIRFLLDANAQKVERTKEGVTLTARTPAGEQVVTGSHLLLAAGRRPNTGDLGLDKAGVKTDRAGFIQVNDRLETNVPGVWALGDVKGGPQFTHISYNDYQIVYANLIEGKSLSIANRYVPYAVFTDPQLGRVGLTEREARATGRPLKIGKMPMSWVARAIERGETAGLMKILVDGESDRILGAAILGSEGGELVQVLGALMLAGAPYTVLKGAVFIHPTLTEGFWTLMEEVK